MKEINKIPLSEVKFHQPQSLPEALKLLQELDQPRVLAGGTDILVDLKQGLARVKNLISRSLTSLEFWRVGRIF